MVELERGTRRVKGIPLAYKIRRVYRADRFVEDYVLRIYIDWAGWSTYPDEKSLRESLDGMLENVADGLIEQVRAG